MILLYTVIVFYLHCLVSVEPRKFHNIKRREKNAVVNTNNSRVELPTKRYQYKFGGTDDRCQEKEKQEYEKIINIFMNKRKLDFLQNKDISIYTKLEMARDTSIKPDNLEAGGLMNDYNFEL